jgi:signal transduction histidine kinase
MNGLPPEAHLGRTCREVVPQFPADAAEAEWRRVIETGQPHLGLERRGETPAVPGQPRSWSEDCYPVRVNGTITGVALIVRETTAEKRMEHLQRLLLGTVGHDLRNPLAVISLSAATLLRRTDLDQSHRRAALRIEHSARQIEVLARDLLDYTVIQRGGGIPVTMEAASMREIVESAVEDVQAANPEAGIRVRCDAEVRGTWDPERIRQVVESLLSNAIKYGHPGEPIQVLLREECDHAVLEVANRGEAIPSERLPYLFSGAWQGRPEARRGGIGLGLLIAREIVLAHSGAVDIRSVEPDGTTVTVRLPRIPRAPA